MRFVLKNQKQEYQQGFTLIEMLVVIVLVGLATAWAIPSYRRYQLQLYVDNYTQALEAGLFNLRANAGKWKVSFKSSPAVLDQFLTPSNIIEYTKPNGSRVDRCQPQIHERLLNSNISNPCDANDPGVLQCPEISNGKREPECMFPRFLKIENTAASKEVEVAISIANGQTSFEITPPGTINPNEVIFRVRSTKHGSLGDQKLQDRCVTLTGNGFLRNSKC